jgi:hypothetical protein
MIYIALNLDEFKGFLMSDKAYVRTETFNGNIDRLQIRSQFNIAVKTSKDGKASVEVEAAEADAKAFSVDHSEGILAITDENLTGSFGNTISIGSVSVSRGGTYVKGMTISGLSFGSISSGNVFINNGRVFVDGVEQKPENVSSSKTIRPVPKITLYLPNDKLFGLELDLSGQAELKSEISFSRAKLSLQGQTKVDVSAQSLEADISGQSYVKAVVTGGKVKLDISGQSKSYVSGEFRKMTVDVSGQSEVILKGIVDGDMKLEASGMSEITHTGKVTGRVHKNTSGMSKIYLRL